jgi:hypothetical protein
MSKVLPCVWNCDSQTLADPLPICHPEPVKVVSVGQEVAKHCYPWTPRLPTTDVVQDVEALGCKAQTLADPLPICRPEHAKVATTAPVAQEVAKRCYPWTPRLFHVQEVVALGCEAQAPDKEVFGRLPDSLKHDEDIV